MPSNSKKASATPDSFQSSINNSQTSSGFSQREAANLVEDSLRSAAITLASPHPQVEVESKNSKKKNSRSESQLSDSSSSDFSTLNSTPGSSSAFVSLLNQSGKTSNCQTPSNETEELGDVKNKGVDKRQKRLLRNRLAAQESRQKKKNYLNNLDAKIKEYEDQNLVLFQRLVNLTDQLNSGSILNDLVGPSCSSSNNLNFESKQLGQSIIPSFSIEATENSLNKGVSENVNSKISSEKN